jgi:hypothetical protein
MHTGTMLFVAAITFAVMAAFGEQRVETSEVIAADSLGMQVMVKEKYGSYVLDTCTVVMLYKGNFVLVHRSRPSGWYPTSFHSVQVVSKFSERADTTDTAPASGAIARGTLSIGAVMDAMAYAEQH